jgi:hypothetical protein
MPYVLDKTLVGRKYEFDDGDSIEIIQIKERSEQHHLVTVLIQQGPGIPRKLVFHYEQFHEYYGHLFRPDSKPHSSKPIISD